MGGQADKKSIIETKPKYKNSEIRKRRWITTHYFKYQNRGLSTSQPRPWQAPLNNRLKTMSQERITLSATGHLNATTCARVSLGSLTAFLASIATASKSTNR